MKKSKNLEREKVFILYHYFLLNQNEEIFQNFLQLHFTESESRRQDVLNWFNSFKEREEEIFKIISPKLDGWEFARIPILERSLLAKTTDDFFFVKRNQRKEFSLLINSAVGFSKKYFEPDRHKYINKIPDLISKDHIEASTSQNRS